MSENSNKWYCSDHKQPGASTHVITQRITVVCIYIAVHHKSHYWLAILFTTNYTQLTIRSSSVVHYIVTTRYAVPKHGWKLPHKVCHKRKPPQIPQPNIFSCQSTHPTIDVDIIQTPSALSLSTGAGVLEAISALFAPKQPKQKEGKMTIICNTTCNLQSKVCQSPILGEPVSISCHL